MGRFCTSQDYIPRSLFSHIFASSLGRVWLADRSHLQIMALSCLTCRILMPGSVTQSRHPRIPTFVSSRGFVSTQKIIQIKTHVAATIYVCILGKSHDMEHGSLIEVAKRLLLSPSWDLCPSSSAKKTTLSSSTSGLS